MRQIKDSTIIEIDVTNACEHRCSNCTRFCGHKKKPYFMDFETFKRAVDSLEGYEGLISLIGGDPLLHPEYNRFAEYLRFVRKNYISMDDGRCKAILKDYPSFAINQKWFENTINRGRGYALFTSMPGNYYLHYEAVEDTVTDLRLNDHTNPSFHQPILVSRYDLGIGDDEFEILRDNCWILDLWSASITPKGVFFCEVAGSLDMLFNGPGGHEITPGWWKADRMEFKDQFHWCDICGMALATYSRNANEEIDDVSSILLKKLQAIDSLKLKKSKVRVFDIGNVDREKGSSIGLDMTSAMGNYLSDKMRVGNLADNLKPQNIYYGITIGAWEDLNDLESSIKELQDGVNGLCVLTLPKYVSPCKDTIEKSGMHYKIIPAEMIPSTIGAKLNIMLKELERQEWIVVSDETIQLPTQFAERISDYFVNPGYLFIIDHQNAKAIMLSGLADTLKKLGHDRLQQCEGMEEIIGVYGKKTCVLDSEFERHPDIDIPYFRDIIWRDYEKDLVFTYALKEKLFKCGVENGNILLLQSGYVYHTLGIYRILKKLGYEVYIISSNKFEVYFNDVTIPERIIYFEEDFFEYEIQESMRKKVRGCADFAGAIVPFSFGPSTVRKIDNYTDALRTAEDIAGRILGIINVRRNFIKPEYDIWDDNAK